MQNLSALLQTCQQTQDQLHADISAEWQQGRSVYGGVQAALAARAMQPLSDGLPIRTLQATLCAPIPAGPVQLDARLLRGSKNTRQIEARIVSGDQTLAVFVGIFGRARESQVTHALAKPADSTNDGLAMPYIDELMPRFLAQFDARILHGHFPGTGHQDTRHLYRISLHDQASQSSLSHVLTIADFPPPVGLSWLKGFTPGSTMTWMLNFTGHSVDGHALDNWLIDVQLDAAHDGYTQQSVSLFAPDGHAVARGTQCMVIYA